MPGKSRPPARERVRERSLRAKSELVSGAQGKASKPSALSWELGSPTGVASGQDAAAERRSRSCASGVDLGDWGHTAAARRPQGQARAGPGDLLSARGLMARLSSAPR